MGSDYCSHLVPLDFVTGAGSELAFELQVREVHLGERTLLLQRTVFCFVPAHSLYYMHWIISCELKRKESYRLNGQRV
jgi:hypothetical protein